MKAQSPEPSKSLDGVVREELLRQKRWATIEAGDFQTFSWTPDTVLIVVGVVFSEPVLVRRVRHMYVDIIAEACERRIPVPAVYFAPRVLKIGEEFLVTLERPMSKGASVTLQFYEAALIDNIRRHHQQRALRETP